MSSGESNLVKFLVLYFFPINNNLQKRHTDILKTDNTRETVRGQQPPTQATHYFYLFFITTEKNCDALFNTIKLHILQKTINN